MIVMSRLSQHACNVKDDRIYAKLFEMRHGSKRVNPRKPASPGNRDERAQPVQKQLDA